ncbi:MAG TPA: endo alpha-1,4 polygalactosaminidase [Tenuifilaceae bacterium]|nr:endo alpha-1,4 polygalactosaminidase [Tenuifilaceae bacterium]
MKKIIVFAMLAIIASACGDDYGDVDFKEEMRNFVVGISQYSKGINPDFIVIPQNGQELVTVDGEENSSPHSTYLNAIDGVGREDLFFGYDEDDIATPSVDRNYMLSFLLTCVSNSVSVLVTDYCWTEENMDLSYAQNEARGFISFAAPNRELDIIPEYPIVPYHVNTDDINTLAEAKNFLYLLNPQNFSSREDFVAAVSQTNYDAIIMDYFFEDDEFTPAQIEALKTKANGGKRLVISYMSIGEAEDYRYYWQSSWNNDPPDWVEEENPEWEGNYKVRYWDKDWQAIIFGNDNSYLKKILDAGFDGVYLDIIDAFEYFED